MYCCNCGKQMDDAAKFCSACGAATPAAQPPAGESRQPRPLTRIREGKKIAGVCGGIARHLELDPTLVRILWIILTIFPPLLHGIIAYIICWIVIPQDPPALTASTHAAASPSPGASA